MDFIEVYPFNNLTFLKIMVYYMYKVRKEVIDMSKHFDAPTQVVFTFDNGTNRERCAGIAYRNEIICGCCGGTFDLEDESNEIEIKKELPWVSLTGEISPEKNYGELEDFCDEDEEERIMGFFEKEAQRWIPVSERLPEEGGKSAGMERGRSPHSCRNLYHWRETKG